MFFILIFVDILKIVERSIVCERSARSKNNERFNMFYRLLFFVFRKSKVGEGKVTSTRSCTCAVSSVEIVTETMI